MAVRGLRRDDIFGIILPAVLQRVATPNLYRRNAFRLLGLPTWATPAQVNRLERQLMISQRLDEDPQLPEGALPLPAPEMEQLREALLRLRDPQGRFVDECFWFWPSQPGEEPADEAYAALRRRDYPAAFHGWEQALKANPHDVVAMHNLAVLAHALALDLEGESWHAGMNDAQARQRKVLWEAALAYWERGLAHQETWNLLGERLRGIDDPRLPGEFPTTLSGTLPLVLLSITAHLAVYNAEYDRKQDVAFHLALLRSGRFGEDIAEKALLDAVDPLTSRIEGLCVTLRKEVTRRPETADAVARRLQEQGAATLSALDLVLSSRHPLTIAAHDQLAGLLLECAILSASTTENWHGVLDILQHAQAAARSDSLTAQIEANRETANKNLEFAVCWFCKDEPADDVTAAQVTMYRTLPGAATRKGAVREWDRLVFHVPRGADCREAHQRVRQAGMIGFIAAGVGALIAGFIIATSSEEWWRWLVVAGVVTALAGLAFLAMAITRGLASRRPIKPEHRKTQYPALRKLRNEGWRDGDRPKGAG
ncbi:MAG: hypothetical protein ACYC7E_00305 [Armatimonadota bacterium]